MSDIASILGSHGPRPVFKDGDKSYPVHHLDQNRKAAFENVLKQMARDELAELRAIYTQEEWREEARQYRKEVNQGLYGFHGELAAEFLDTPDGSLALMRILLEATPDELQDLLSRRGDELKLFLEEIVAASTPDEEPRKASEGPEGNATAPADPRRESASRR